jgi:hypothetical protein
LDKILLSLGIIICMSCTNNKMSLLIFCTLATSPFITCKLCAAIALMVGPPVPLSSKQLCLHSQASSAALLLSNHLEPIFDICSNKLRAIEQIRVVAITCLTKAWIKRLAGAAFTAAAASAAAATGAVAATVSTSAAGAAASAGTAATAGITATLAATATPAALASSAATSAATGLRSMLGSSRLTILNLWLLSRTVVIHLCPVTQAKGININQQVKFLYFLFKVLY